MNSFENQVDKIDLKYVVEGGELIVYLPQKVDMKSTLGFERELYCLINKGKNTKTVIDAAEVEFISLAALRVLEKLRLEFGNVKMINISPGVHELVKQSGYIDLY